LYLLLELHYLSEQAVVPLLVVQLLVLAVILVVVLEANQLNQL
jgi:hypothetical protein